MATPRAGGHTGEGWVRATSWRQEGWFGSIAGTSTDLCGVHKNRFSARLRFACVVCLAVLLCRLSGVRLGRGFGLVLAFLSCQGV